MREDTVEVRGVGSEPLCHTGGRKDGTKVNPLWGFYEADALRRRRGPVDPYANVRNRPGATVPVPYVSAVSSSPVLGGRAEKPNCAFSSGTSRPGPPLESLHHQVSTVGVKGQTDLGQAPVTPSRSSSRSLCRSVGRTPTDPQVSGRCLGVGTVGSAPEYLEESTRPGRTFYWGP